MEVHLEGDKLSDMYFTYGETEIELSKKQRQEARRGNR